MDNLAVARLRQVLKARCDQLGGWQRLADRIQNANGNDPACRIDRRTLERLCSEDFEDVRLRIEQLVGIDQYFIQKNAGPLLARPDSLLDVVAESPAVNFFVASKYDETLNTEVVSRWDLRGITRLLRTRLSPLELKIWDIRGPDDWEEERPKAKHEAKIAIASPIASYASEALLAEMIGVQPRGECNQNQLPFFIVGADRDRDVKSVFVRSRRDAMKRDPMATDKIAPQYRGLIVEDKVFAQTREEDYGLLVAQRHPDERQIHMVLCGLTGPSSYKLAKILQNGGPPESLPQLRKGETEPPILVAVFKMAVEWPETKEKQDREMRRVLNSHLIYGPTLFRRVDQRWQSMSGDEYAA